MNVERDACGCHNNDMNKLYLKLKEWWRNSEVLKPGS